MEKYSSLSLLMLDKGIHEYSLRVSNDANLSKDIISEIFIYLFELPDEKFYKIKDLKSYVCKMIYLSWNSSTSPFYRKYRATNFIELPKIEKVESEIIESDFETYDNLLEELGKLELRISERRYPSEVRLFELYTELGTYRAVSDAVGIPLKSVHYQIKKVIDEMKTKI